MRVMMTVQCDVEAGNQAMADGSLPKLIEKMMGELKPEAAYFYVEDGARTGFMVFEMADIKQLPSVCEPFYQLVKARINVIPVMNAQELAAGVGEVMKNAKLVGAGA